MIFGMDNTQNQKTALALGMFDGIHIGHKAVLQNAIDSGLFPIAVTFFDTGSNKNDLLMEPMKKKDILLGMGFKQVVMMNFESVRGWLPLPFLSMLRKNFNPELICCGFNYRFGINASAGVDMLEEYCDAHDIRCMVSEPVNDENGDTVSSSRIRELISSGKVDEANKLMISDFSFTRPVERGDGVGHDIGYPTINQELPTSLVTPKFGVYAAKAIVNEQKFDAVINIGTRPTRPAENPLCETHIIGFNGDIYDREVTIGLKRFLRGEKKFSSNKELAEAICNDINNTTREK